MQQEQLFHEDFEGALGTCVSVLGGAKRVGVMLRPEYEEDPDKAARWLLACLNPQRDEKLTWDQTFAIMRSAKEKGCHAGMAYIAQEVGYADPQPIEPEDELAALQRKFIGAAESIAPLLSRIEQLQTRSRRRA